MIICGRDKEKDPKGCCVHERQLLLSLLCSYLPETEIFKTQPCALRNFDTLKYILIIFGRNKEEDQ